MGDVQFLNNMEEEIIKNKRNWKKILLIILIIFGIIILSFFVVTGAIYIYGDYSAPDPLNSPTYYQNPINPNNNSVGFVNKSGDEQINLDKDNGNIYSRGNLTMNYSNGNGFGYFAFLGSILSPITNIWATRADIPTLNSTTLNASSEVYIDNVGVKQYLYNQTQSAYFYNMTQSPYFYNMTQSAYFYNQSLYADNFIKNGSNAWLNTLNVSGELVSGLINISGAGGKVGIGTASPAVNLEINATSAGNSLIRITSQDEYDQEIEFWNSGTNVQNGRIVYDESGGDMYIYNDYGACSTCNLFLGTASTQILTITGSGLVGIGTTAPAYLLETAKSPIGANLSGTLYVNGTSGMVGVGNLNPSAKLDILSTTDNHLRLTHTAGTYYWNIFRQASDGSLVFNDSIGSPEVVFTSGGNVGIGTTTPDATLEVIGQIYVDANDDASSILLSDTGITSYVSDLNLRTRLVQDIYLGNNTNNYMKIEGTNGNVGIGTTSPTQTLDVNGNINISAATGNLTMGGGKIYYDVTNARLVIKVS